MLGEEVEKLGALVADFGDGEGLAGAGISEGGEVAGVFEEAVGVGDGGAVWVPGGVGELGLHVGEDFVGDGMFEDFGLVVDFGPVHVEAVDEVEFEDAVAAEDVEGEGAAGGGEADALAGLVVDEAGVVEGFEHGGDGAGGDAEALGEGAEGDEAVGGLFGEFPDVFGVVFDGGGGHGGFIGRTGGRGRVNFCPGLFSGGFRVSVGIRFRFRGMSMKFSFAVSAVFALLAAGCGRPPSGQGGPPEGDFPVNVVGAPVETRTVRETVRLVGSVVAVDALDVRSQRMGEVVGVHVEQGQVVNGGDLLFSLDRAALESRREELRARRVLADQTLERVKRLRETESATEQELDQAVAAKAEVEAQLSAVETELKETEIRAPFAGVAGERMIWPGDIVQPGMAMVRLVRMSPLEVRFEVPERYLGALRPGLVVEIESEAFRGEVFEASVSFVAPEVREATRTVTVRASMENPEGRLRPGMFVEVGLVIAERENSRVVPEAAVMQRGRETMVMRANGEGRAEIVPVQVGVRFDGKMEIVEGLAAEDRVVVEGLIKAQPGMLLNFVAESERFGLNVEAGE